MRVIVLRFSALGDIALTIPVLKALKEQYPYLEITVVSRAFARPLFRALDIDFYPVDFDNNHKGLSGLYRLFKELKKKYKPDFIVDLHNVLRTKILGMYFKSSSLLVFRLDKQRPAKRALTRFKNKIRKPVRHTTERYAEVFGKAAFPIKFQAHQAVNILEQHPFKSFDLIDKAGGRGVIGIAPMARHKGKVWPLRKVGELIELLLADDHQIVLFGSEDEWESLEKLVISKDVINIAGNFVLDRELEIMAQLDVMVAMDSSNMHLATLSGTPVVSIWGATHSYAGFGPLGQNDAYKVEIPPEQLQCRPCSVFGNKPCLRGDYACMNWITPELVKEKIDLVLLNQ